MIKFITVWVLTVTGVKDTPVGVAGYEYQLQYASQKTCLAQAEKHREKRVRTEFGKPNILLNEGQTVRCDFMQVPMLEGK